MERNINFFLQNYKIKQKSQEWFLKIFLIKFKIWEILLVLAIHGEIRKLIKFFFNIVIF